MNVAGVIICCPLTYMDVLSGRPLSLPLFLFSDVSDIVYTPSFDIQCDITVTDRQTKLLIVLKPLTFETHPLSDCNSNCKFGSSIKFCGSSGI